MASPSEIPGANNTGFPEPFCRYRNTTLAYPGARVGDDAVIGGEISPSFAPRRRFTMKHKHTISWGSIPTDDEAAFIKSKRPTRPTRADSLASMQDRIPDRPFPAGPRRGVSFAIAEGEEDEDEYDGVETHESSDPADGDLVVVGHRNHDHHHRPHQLQGHHRLGSVDSAMSADSYGGSPPGSGDESSADSARKPAQIKRRRSLFTLLRRSTSRSS